MTVGPAVLVRVLRERVGTFLLDHCQVGFAVMFIIGEFPSLRPWDGLGFGWV